MKRLVSKEGDNIVLTQENLYNGNGQRIRKTEADKETNYYYQNGSVHYSKDASDAVISLNIAGISENVIGSVIDDNYYVYTKDIRESTVNLIDDKGQSQISYEYTDYGQTKINGNTEIDNEICYTGGIYDSSTGIYYLNARYYNPENANFLSQDTYRGEIGDPESLNYYGYCQGNPVTYTDPSGHIPLLAAAMWGYRVYKGYKAVKNTAKLVKTTYKVAKKVKKLSSFKKSYKVVKAGKKAKRIVSKPKASKKLKKVENKSYKKSRVKTVKKYTINKVSKKNVHGNSKNSTKEQHGYEIFTSDGDVVKTGISGGKINKKGKSYRATRQVNKLNREAKAKGSSIRYDSRIVVKLPNREKALKWEVLNAERLKKYNSMRYHKRP